jgi:hypothetical protein
MAKPDIRVGRVLGTTDGDAALIPSRMDLGVLASHAGIFLRIARQRLQVA